MREYYSFIFMALMSFSLQMVNKLLTRLLFLVALIAFFINMRTSGFDTDLAKYASWLSTDFWNFYTNREILYFAVSRGIYALVKSSIITFLIMDAMWLIILWKSVKIWEEGRDRIKLFAIFLVSFPIFMGLENFYRQNMSFAFLALAFVLIAKRGKVVSGWLVYVCAVFFHNSAVLVFPVYVAYALKKLNVKNHYFYSMCVSLMLAVALAVFAAVGGGLEKSNAATGLNLKPLYYGLFISLLVIAFMVKEFSFSRVYNDLLVPFHALIILFPIYLLYQDAPMERTAQIFIELMMFELWMEIKQIRPYFFIPVTLLIYNMSLCLPVLIFSSTRKFVGV